MLILKFNLIVIITMESRRGTKLPTYEEFFRTVGEGLDIIAIGDTMGSPLRALECDVASQTSKRLGVMGRALSSTGNVCFISTFYQGDGPESLPLRVDGVGTKGPITVKKVLSIDTGPHMDRTSDPAIKVARRTFDGEIVVEDPYYPIAFLENPSLEAEIAMQRNANVSRLGDTPQESAMATIAELYAYAVDLCLKHQPNPNQD